MTPMDSLASTRCKGCGKTLSAALIGQIGKTDANDWCKEGYCSNSCYQQNHDSTTISTTFNKHSELGKSEAAVLEQGIKDHNKAVESDSDLESKGIDKPTDSNNSKAATNWEIDDVFERTERMSKGKRISDHLYNLLIGLVLLWGFLINFLLVKYVPYDSIASISPWIFFPGYLISCFIGVAIFTKSEVPFVSFIGYNFVVVPFGLVINLVVYRFDPSIVLDAIRVTGLVTILMMILGSLFPVFFRKIAGALTVALLAVIVIALIDIFFFGMYHAIIDWAVVLIFSGYIAYDWGRANAIPKTVDNAIDIAAALYMDIINLFLRILSIMDRK